MLMVMESIYLDFSRFACTCACVCIWIYVLFHTWSVLSPLSQCRYSAIPAPPRCLGSQLHPPPSCPTSFHTQPLDHGVLKTSAFQEFYVNEIIDYVNFRGWLPPPFPGGAIPSGPSSHRLVPLLAEVMRFFAPWMWTSRLEGCTFLPEAPLGMVFTLLSLHVFVCYVSLCSVLLLFHVFNHGKLIRAQFLPGLI